MRIGIIALLHESNTFVRETTTLDHFRRDLYLRGEAVRNILSKSHHEIGGFFAGLDECCDATVNAVPLVAFRATPSGVIADETFESLSRDILESVNGAGTLDGILVAAHGAAVSQRFADADGEWLARLRSTVGPELPIIATLDAHANLSRHMVESCDALIAYRTNPHLDQRDRGREAAQLMIATVRNELRPTMAAAFPPLVINIERQCTDEPHLLPLYEIADEQRNDPDVISNSILLGFPYADVSELGAATIVVTNYNAKKARELAHELGAALWNSREAMRGQLVGVDEALDQCSVDQCSVDQCSAVANSNFCLLDMGDNVGGGSAGDGTDLLCAIVRRKVGPSFVCICDSSAVAECERVGVGSRLTLSVGGKTDDQHGPPFAIDVEVLSIQDGRYTETQSRHGGILTFDQGRTALVRAIDGDTTLMLSSLRVPPFSIQQLTSCGLEPRDFRIIVAKGVNAPLAAYREVCDRFIRVNTIGSTCADLSKLTFHHRRKPLFPFENETEWSHN